METSENSDQVKKKEIEDNLKQGESSINDTQAGIIWATSFLGLAVLFLIHTDNKTGPAVFIGFALYTLYKVYKEAK